LCFYAEALEKLNGWLKTIPSFCVYVDIEMYLCFTKVKAGCVLANTNKFAFALDLHYLCNSKCEHLD